MSERKITYNKKMSLRDYVNLAYFLETGKYEMDLSDCEPSALKEIKQYSLRVTKEQKKKIDQFFDRFVLGQSAISIKDCIPKIKKMPGQVVQSIPVSVAAPAIPAPAVPVVEQPIVQPVVADEGEPVIPKAASYPVYSDEERWQIAEMIDKEANPNLSESSIDKSLYPFIKDWNKPLDIDNFDSALCMKMAEDAKIDVVEVSVLVGMKYRKLLALSPSAFPDMPERYKGFPELATAIMQATDLGHKKRAIMNEPDLTEDELVDKFFHYLDRRLQIVNAEGKERVAAFMDIIYKVANDTIYFKTTDEDCEEEFEEIRYNNADDMKNDLILFAEKYKLDFGTQLDVFGKKTSIKKIVKEYLKKYPNGFDGKWYATTKAAYLAGEYEL